MVVTSLLGSSRLVGGGALAARAAWLGSQGPRGSGSSAASAGTIRREAAHRALHRRFRATDQARKASILESARISGSLSPDRWGVRTASSSPRAAARRERVRVRQVVRGVRSSLATRLGSISAHPSAAPRCGRCQPASTQPDRRIHALVSPRVDDFGCRKPEIQRCAAAFTSSSSARRALTRCAQCPATATRGSGSERGSRRLVRCLGESP